MANNVEVFDSGDETAARDVGFARMNIYKTMNVVDGALEELKDIAHSSQNPSAYRVLAELAKVSIEGNSTLLDNQLKRKEIMEGPAPTTVNQNLHLTTEQLQKLLESKKD